MIQSTSLRHLLALTAVVAAGQAPFAQAATQDSRIKDHVHGNLRNWPVASVFSDEIDRGSPFAEEMSEDFVFPGFFETRAALAAARAGKNQSGVVLPLDTRHNFLRREKEAKSSDDISPPEVRSL